MKDTFVVKGIREIKEVEERIAEIKSEMIAKNGLEAPFVVVFQNLKKYKSIKQNNAFHGLLSLFFRSGCYSCGAETFQALKNYYKKKIGLIRSYVYFNGEKIIEVKNKSDIPAYINLKACRIILESFSRATRTQAREGIDLIKTEMLKSGIEQTTYAKEFWQVINELES